MKCDTLVLGCKLFPLFRITNCATVSILAHFALGPLRVFPQAVFPELLLPAWKYTQCGHNGGLPPEPLLVLQDLVLSARLTFASMIAVKGDIIV